jgi:hypothetical protein
MRYINQFYSEAALTQTNKKKYQDYINRWQLVKEVEDREIQEAPFDLLFKQTLSIWDLGRSLDFFSYKDTPESIWPYLQQKWIKANAGK